MTNHQEITVVITGFNPGYPHGPDHTVGKHDLRIDIDASDDQRPGGWKSQEAEIESAVVSGLNFVLEKLRTQRAQETADIDQIVDRVYQGVTVVEVDRATHTFKIDVVDEPIYVVSRTLSPDEHLRMPSVGSKIKCNVIRDHENDLVALNWMPIGDQD